MPIITLSLFLGPAGVNESLSATLALGRLGEGGEQLVAPFSQDAAGAEFAQFVDHVARGGFGLAEGPDGTGDISFEELPPGLVQGDVSHISLLSGVSATGGLRNPR